LPVVDVYLAGELDFGFSTRRVMKRLLGVSYPLICRALAI
jgi:hypothetical protein